MIFQLFPRVQQPYTMRYSPNTQGSLEIIPKPSGMGIYTRPTRLSTHAALDDYLDNAIYDNSGIRVMRNDEGYECVYISHSLHGRYLQIGVQERDRYTRYRQGYNNPSRRNPPLNWSMRFMGRLQTPVELLPQVWDRTGFVGTEDGKENGVRVYNTGDMREIERAPWEIRYAPVVRGGGRADMATVNRTLRKVGDLSIDPRGGKVGMAFARSMVVIGDGVGKEALWAVNLADNVPDAMNYDTKNIFPDLKVQAGVFKYFPMYLLPFAKSYVPYSEAGTKWGLWKVDGYKPDVRGPDNDTRLIPLHTITPSAGNATRIDTSVWNISKYMVFGTRECLFDWPLCTYDVAEDKRTKEAGKGTKHHKRATFVPMMAMFFPYADQKGPIDHVTGRRLCYGGSVLMFITTDPIATYYDNDAPLTLIMTQLQHPITKIFRYDSAFDLGKECGGPSEDAPMPMDEADYHEVGQAQLEEMIRREEALWNVIVSQSAERGTQTDIVIAEGNAVKETQTDVPAPLGMGKLLTPKDEKDGAREFPGMWSNFTYYEKKALLNQLELDDDPNIQPWGTSWYLREYKQHNFKTPLDMLVDKNYYLNYRRGR